MNTDTPAAPADRLARPRVPWSLFSTTVIEAVAQEARLNGDEELYRRARRALARRR